MSRQYLQIKILREESERLCQVGSLMQRYSNCGYRCLKMRGSKVRLQRIWVPRSHTWIF